MLRRALDLMVRPMVVDFSFSEALRVRRTDLLHGASAAANIVSVACGDALRGDMAMLDALHQDGAVDVRLHERLCQDALRSRQQGDVAMREAELLRRRSHLQGAASIEEVRLIVGAHRATWSSGDGMRRLDFLPSLAIVAPHHAGSLWAQETQQALLASVGCTVQCRVRYEATSDVEATAGPPQLYLFEAAVTGEELIASCAKPRRSFAGLRFGEVEVDATDYAPPIALVDINGLVGNAAFWHSAESANPFPFCDNG